MMVNYNVILHIIPFCRLQINDYLSAIDSFVGTKAEPGKKAQASAQVAKRKREADRKDIKAAILKKQKSKHKKEKVRAAKDDEYKKNFNENSTQTTASFVSLCSVMEKYFEAKWNKDFRSDL